MELGLVFCLRIFSFILVTGLCLSKLANAQQQILPLEENNYFSWESSSIGIDHQTQNEDVSTTDERTLTVWMKSQLFHGRGLTVYESGNIIYRVDNYKNKHSKMVLLMDDAGEVVFTIFKRYKFWYPWWEGYTGLESSSSRRSKKASFGVTKHFSCFLFTRRPTKCKVKYNDRRYTLEPCRIKKSRKLEFKVIDADGNTIAEMKQKYAREGGVMLGRDVLSLKVEPVADVSFVVALVAVFGLINGEI